MVRFPPELRDVPVELKSKDHETLPSSPKLSVNYIMNLLQLGDFSREIEFTNQELIVDKIIDLCGFYAISVPKTFKQAMSSPDKDAWSKAIAIELNNLEEMRVWVLRLQPPDKKPLGGRWVFATKPDTDGAGVRFKARYVAKGFTQIEGQDFLKTFAPTATFVSLRLLMVVAGALKWPVQSFDFVAAYLNSPIDEEVWVKPLEGMKAPAGHALLLKKALYGTRQAARCWWLHLKNVLDKYGYSPSQYDNSLYILRHTDQAGVIWLHVDDGVVTASNIEILKKLEGDLKGILKIKWSQTLDSIVGLNVVRSDRGFQLYQKELVNSILEEHWDGVSKATTPLPSNYNATTDDEGNTADSGKYLSVIGSLSYLAVGTRPDICFAVNYLARFSAKPGVLHWKGVHHLINYLAGSKDLRLCLFPSTDHQPLKAFADASWGGEFSRSSYGVLITFLNCPVLWVSRRQQSVASSTCHAEYMALGIATRQVGATSSQRRFERKFSLFQKKTSLEWVGTKDQLADIFTKCMAPDSFLTTPSESQQPVPARAKAGVVTGKLTIQKEPREMVYPTTKRNNASNSKRSSKQRDRGRGDLVISRFDSLAHKWGPENNDKEVHQISLIKDSILRLHSSILPQLRDRIRTLSEALDPEDLLKDPHSKLGLIMEIQSDLDRTLDQLVLATHIAFSKPRKLRSEQTNDYHLRECKSYRLGSAEDEFSIRLQWQEKLLRSASNALKSIDLAIHWFIRPELDLVQTSWGPYQSCINRDLEALLQLNELEILFRPNRNQFDSKPRHESFLKLGKSAVPLLKLCELFFNKLSVQAMSGKRLPHFTTMSSHQLYILLDLAKKVQSETSKLTGALVGAKVHEEPVCGEQLKEALQPLDTSFQVGSNLINLYCVSIIPDTLSQNYYRDWLATWNTLFSIAISNLLEACGIFEAERSDAIGRR
ncbi:hypothetical protein PSTT_14074 [Puccinia striiformis]|uniref:Reverse transcriptase Ty1/copia-type domain-containing protein n=1 Tax=Puccinia striiformis TaxID=27350 RepID=A0A2S4UPE3_9BASI|nr:hypothetical protein PSTT_14074 [Puccinia striiformis]